MEYDDKQLIIGIGDLHGHYPALESLLGGLQDKYEIFKGDILSDDVRLVFTGDYIDRGQFNLKVISKMLSLSKDNNVIQLLGNHELMALACLDYAKDLADKDLNSESYKFSCLHGLNGGYDFVREFSVDSRLALKEYISQMDRNAEIGKWIRNLKPFYLTQINNEKILFVHGGLSKFLIKPEDIDNFANYFNNRMQISTKQLGGYYKKFFDSQKLGPSGPFWDRNLHKMSEKDIVSSLSNIELDYLVIAHTPHKKIVNYIDKVFDIDVGMTPRYGENSPTAIVFRSGAVYSFIVGEGENKLVI
jgi:predicted MPP superfamily phosphohydrolase